MINKNEIKLYQEIDDKLYDLAKDIIKYIKINYPNLLSFDQHSTFEDFDLSTDNFDIKYYDSGYDLYEGDCISIPLDELYNETWKEWLERKENDRVQKIYEEQKQLEINKKNEELKLLKYLKEKYE